jgi:hypothetical protein
MLRLEAFVFVLPTSFLPSVGSFSILNGMPERSISILAALKELA